MSEAIGPHTDASKATDIRVAGKLNATMASRRSVMPTPVLVITGTSTLGGSLRLVGISRMSK
ncbi:hypothetical protein [Candidatus Alkanophaga liquidiphilum]